jgi:uncharacterized membrane protein YccC
LHPDIPLGGTIATRKPSRRPNVGVALRPLPNVLVHAWRVGVPFLARR